MYQFYSNISLISKKSLYMICSSSKLYVGSFSKRNMSLYQNTIKHIGKLTTYRNMHNINSCDKPHKNLIILFERTFSTSAADLKGRGMIYGKRCFPDHRGNITATNRPDGDYISSEDDPESILDDSDYASLVYNAQGFSAGVVGKVGLEGNIHVILPWIKWGPLKKTVTTDNLLLDEACALANSLKNVNVVSKEIVKIRHESREELFGPGQLDRLASKIKNMSNLSAVFVSIDIIHINQIRSLEQAFGCRVVDRYWLVLSIFHQHANTLEAKMQVSLAELPYIRTRVTQDNEKTLLDDKIRKLQTQLKKLARQRENVRKNRDRQSLPAVAVVGYTNTGKTSLISSLSGNTKLEGKDQLFATLDVTAHATKLPWGVKVLMLDTVGFIQDLPTTLVASFNATLQDAAHADVVVHVRDLSHPDRLMHHATVMSALYSINLPIDTPIITLDNKVDLLDCNKVTDEIKTSHESDDKTDLKINNLNSGLSYLSENEDLKKLYKREGDFNSVIDALITEEVDDVQSLENERLKLIINDFKNIPSIVVSAKTNDGLLTAGHAIEEQILRVTNKKVYRITLPTGSDHVRILHKIADISEEEINETTNQTRTLAIMDPKQLSKFKKACRKLKEMI